MRGMCCPSAIRAIGLHCVLALVISLTVNQSRVRAQDYQIGNGVFGNGGGKVVAASYAINGTVGQSLIGVSSDASYTVTSGICHDISGVLWTDVRDELVQASTLPSEYKLDQNYPNPFNPTTTIRFSLPKRSHTTLRIYNILGRVVMTLVDESLSAGEYEVTLNADGLTSGLYVCRLTAGRYVESRKLVLIK